MAFLALMPELVLEAVEGVGFSTIAGKVAEEFKPAVKEVASNTLGNAIGDYGKKHPHGFVSKTVDEAYKKKNERPQRPNGPPPPRKYPKRTKKLG
tara:strand:+ start:4367 stop:4651 length:285 start_codon:yes stop_codon:yes gene_type:complete